MSVIVIIGVSIVMILLVCIVENWMQIARNIIVISSVYLTVKTAQSSIAN